MQSFECKSDSVEVLEHSPPRRIENRDFWIQKVKSRYSFRIVTKVVLSHFESFKTTFAVFKVPKRIFLAWTDLKVQPFQRKSDSVEVLEHSPPRRTENRDFGVLRLSLK